MRVADVWAAVRAGDKVGRAAAASGFQPSVDCSVSLFIDPRKSDQVVRGAAALPHGSGRATRVAVFAGGADDAAAALAAGAALAGGEALVKEVASSKRIDADVVLATVDMVPALGRVARILGPRCAPVLVYSVCLIQQRSGISTGLGTCRVARILGPRCAPSASLCACDSLCVCYNRDKASRPAWPAR